MPPPYNFNGGTKEPFDAVPGGQIERPQSPDYIPNRARTRATAPQTTACPLQWGCHVGFNGTEDFALAAQQDDAPAALHPAGELRGAVFLAGAAGRHGENIAPNPRAPDRVVSGPTNL